MTIRIASFDPYTASDQLWAAFNETRRAIAREFWPDDPCSMTLRLGGKSRRSIRWSSSDAGSRWKGTRLRAPSELRSADPVHRTRKIMPGFCGQVAESGQARGGAVSALCYSVRCTN